MSILWISLVFISILFAYGTGNTQALATASLSGASSAVELSIAMTGGICLWSGLMEVMRQCGILEQITKALSPLLLWLYPELRGDRKTLTAISANTSANLLGLGNAATPLGLEAVKGLSSYAKQGRATHGLCLFIVCNTASIQLLPTTIATLRAATGSENPLDILPAVWLSSLGSITVGICCCKMFQYLENHLSRRKVP